MIVKKLDESIDGKSLLGGPIEPDESVCSNSPTLGEGFSRSAEER